MPDTTDSSETFIKNCQPAAQPRAVRLHIESYVMKRIFYLLSPFFLFSLIQAQDTLNITGEWEGKAKDGTLFKYTFLESGDVNWETRTTSYGTQSVNAKYKLNKGKQFWEIDIYNFQDDRLKTAVFLGIIEVVSANRIKFEGLPSSAGKRITKFGKYPILLKRIK